MSELIASPPSPGFRSMFESYRLERNLRVKRVKFAANIATKACQNLSSKTAVTNRSQNTGRKSFPLCISLFLGICPEN